MELFKQLACPHRGQEEGSANVNKEVGGVTSKAANQEEITGQAEMSHWEENLEPSLTLSRSLSLQR